MALMLLETSTSGVRFLFRLHLPARRMIAPAVRGADGIEIAGRHHYADGDGQAVPRRYAEMGRGRQRRVAGCEAPIASQATSLPGARFKPTGRGPQVGNSMTPRPAYNLTQPALQ